VGNNLLLPLIFGKNKRFGVRKKHLKNLNSLEKWLSGEGVATDELRAALNLLRQTAQTIPEEEETKGSLPVPAEIHGDPLTVALYSDGGCRGNPGPGACAFVVQNHEGEVLTEGVEFEGHTTNNKMELSGPLHGLHELLDVLPQNGRDPLLTKIKVITDSKYVVDGMKSWLAGWKARGWKKADGKVPENLELWQSLDDVTKKFMQVDWQWVKGHGGHPQNEYCDRRANELMDANSSR
jgi:ribonuclease HI